MSGNPVTLTGNELTIWDVGRVARDHIEVTLTQNEEIMGRVTASHEFIMRAAETGDPIYGVTSGFGGMANVIISPEDASELQSNLDKGMVS